MTAPRTIRTIADLAQLTGAELDQCGRALLEEIRQRQRAHRAAIDGGTTPAATPLDFAAFEWRPRPRDIKEVLEGVQLDTPIDALPLPRSARAALRDRGIVCVEDLTTISEPELTRMPNVGATAIGRIRSVLQGFGLDFAEHPNPEVAAHHHNQSLRGLAPDELSAARASLPDQAPVFRLGLNAASLERAQRGGWSTVGDLRNASLQDLGRCYGPKGLREVIEALDATGTGLRCGPSPAELWSAGVMTVEEMTKPQAEGTPIAELRPWIGSVVDRLAANGVATLGRLRELARAQQLAGVRGIGKPTLERLLAFLDDPQLAGAPSRAAPAMADLAAAWGIGAKLR